MRARACAVGLCVAGVGRGAGMRAVQQGVPAGAVHGRRTRHGPSVPGHASERGTECKRASECARDTVRAAPRAPCRAWA